MEEWFVVDYQNDEVRPIAWDPKGNCPLGQNPRSAQSAAARGMVGLRYFPTRQEAVDALLGRLQGLVDITTRNLKEAQQRLLEAQERLGYAEEKFRLVAS